MRSAELLEALSKCTGGVQVNMSRSGVTVTTRYTPLVRGTGKTLFEAAFATSTALMQHPLKHLCPEVVADLKKYDRRSEMLSL